MFTLLRRVTTNDIPNGDALRFAMSAGATWANVACVGAWAKMNGDGRLVMYRSSVVTAWTTAGGFDVRYQSAMPSAHDVDCSYEIDAAGAEGIGFADHMALDLWDSPIIIKNGASGGMVQGILQNDSGGGRPYALAVQLVAWQ